MKIGRMTLLALFGLVLVAALAVAGCASGERSEDDGTLPHGVASAGVGETATVGVWNITVAQAQFVEEMENVVPAEGFRILSLDIELENTDRRDLNISLDAFALLDETPTTYRPAQTTSAVEFEAEPIGAGDSKTANLVFLVSETIDEYTLRFQPGGDVLGSAEIQVP